MVRLDNQPRFPTSTTTGHCLATCTDMSFSCLPRAPATEHPSLREADSAPRSPDVVLRAPRLSAITRHHNYDISPSRKPSRDCKSKHHLSRLFLVSTSEPVYRSHVVSPAAATAAGNSARVVACQVLFAFCFLLLFLCGLHLISLLTLFYTSRHAASAGFQASERWVGDLPLHIYSLLPARDHDFDEHYITSKLARKNISKQGNHGHQKGNQGCSGSELGPVALLFLYGPRTTAQWGCILNCLDLDGGITGWSLA